MGTPWTPTAPTSVWGKATATAARSAARLQPEVSRGRENYHLIQCLIAATVALLCNGIGRVVA